MGYRSLDCRKDTFLLYFYSERKEVDGMDIGQFVGLELGSWGRDLSDSFYFQKVGKWGRPLLIASKRRGKEGGGKRRLQQLLWKLGGFIRTEKAAGQPGRWQRSVQLCDFSSAESTNIFPIFFFLSLETRVLKQIELISFQLPKCKPSRIYHREIQVSQETLLCFPSCLEKHDESSGDKVQHIIWPITL